MTFEEFFAKKRIDLVQFEKAEPVLYHEFKNHFAAMGEKSFDHTKKFWFNKLRGLYHLAHPEKAVTKAETALASQAEPLSSLTIEQKPASIPRFKSTTVGKTDPAAENQAQANPVAKPAFKPRNIPVKNSEVSPEITEKDKTENKPAIKPGFKPRNIQVKPSETEAEEPKENHEESSPVVKKPGFKPRNIQPAADANATDANTPESRPGQPGISEESKPEQTAKEGYKPRFKLKNLPGKSISEEVTETENSLPETKPEQLADSDINRKISS